MLFTRINYAILRSLFTSNLKECAPLDNETGSSQEEEETSGEETSKTLNNNLEDFEQVLKTLGTNKGEIEPLDINKLSSSYKKKTVYNIPAKPYYHRPTLVDLQLENTLDFNMAHFDGKSIIEWNIDGLPEYQIQMVLNYMTMYATACRINRTNDPDIVKAIVQGFSGQLKGWWDFHIPDASKTAILQSVKTEHQANEAGQIIALQIPDSVNTLIYTIAKHFIGAASMQLDKTQEQLMNLKLKERKISLAPYRRN